MYPQLSVFEIRSECFGISKKIVKTYIFGVTYTYILVVCLNILHCSVLSVSKELIIIDYTIDLQLALDRGRELAHSTSQCST